MYEPKVKYSAADLRADIVVKNKYNILDIIDIFNQLNIIEIEKSIKDLQTLVGSYAVDDPNGVLDDTLSVLKNLVVLRNNQIAIENRTKGISFSNGKTNISLGLTIDDIKVLNETEVKTKIEASRAASAVDATNKANKALADAKVYTDQQIGDIPPVDLSAYRKSADQDVIDKKTLTDAKAYTDAEIAKIPVVDLSPYRKAVDQDVIDKKTLADAKAYTDEEIGKLPNVTNPLLEDYEEVASLTINGEYTHDPTKPNDYLLLSAVSQDVGEAQEKVSFIEGSGFIIGSDTENHAYGEMTNGKFIVKGGSKLPMKILRRKEN